MIVHSLFENVSLQSNNNFRTLAVQLIQTGGNSIQPAELVQTLNENFTWFKLDWIGWSAYEWTATFRLRSTFFWMSRNSDVFEWHLNTVNRAKTLLKRLKCIGFFFSQKVTYCVPLEFGTQNLFLVSFLC